MLRDAFVDLRHGLRLMRRNPGFSIVALLTLALGIGANTAMFSIVRGVILKPLPFPEADRLVLLEEAKVSRGLTSVSIPPLDFWDWRERNRSMELLAAYREGTTNYTGGDRPQQLAVYRVSEDFLEILGRNPNRGRGITAGDLEASAAPVVVLTHGFWQQAFGGDPGVLGRSMVLDGTAHVIVGVLPASWRGLSRTGTDLILPLRTEPFWLLSRGYHYFHGLGRLKRGVTLEQAQSDLSSVAAALEADYPATNTGWGATVSSLEQVTIGPIRPQLLIFMASVGLVLLIACANLANMTLARATIRTRELAIRTAVGAARSRVVRQVLTESVLLAGVGGTLGVILASVALRVFVAEWPTMLPRMREVRMDAAVLLFSGALSLASGILFGLLPALNVTGANLAEILRQGGRSLAGDRTRRAMRAGLVIGQVAVAVVLLVSAGLLVRSFATLQDEDPGFRTQSRLVFSTPLPEAKYASRESMRAFAAAALARIEALPGVQSAGLTSLLPLGGRVNYWGLWIEGRPSVDDQADGSALIYRVSPTYFATMGIRILAGRGVAPEDREGGRLVVVISTSLAEQYFHGVNPVGQRIRFDAAEDEPWWEIVGVVADVEHDKLGQTSLPQMYIPFSQEPTETVSFVIRASVPPLSLANSVRGAIEAVDPDLPVVGIQTGDAMIAGTIALPRFRTLLMTGFGLAALLLAVVGLYGVLAYSVSQRAQEIGVRMALGATRGSVLGLVVREGGPLVGIGVAVGLAGALALSRILESMLFGVGARDPVVFVTVPVLLTLVAVTAMLVPARQAMRVDPIRTLAGG